MVHPDCPNIWDKANGNYAGVIDNCTLGWVYHSIVGYQKFFPNQILDYERYVNNGMIVLPEDVSVAKKLCKEIIHSLDSSKEGMMQSSVLASISQGILFCKAMPIKLQKTVIVGFVPESFGSVEVILLPKNANNDYYSEHETVFIA